MLKEDNYVCYINISILIFFILLVPKVCLKTDMGKHVHMEITVTKEVL